MFFSSFYHIKHYKTDKHSLSNGQVLPRPYKYQEACIVFREMIDMLCSDMYRKIWSPGAFPGGSATITKAWSISPTMTGDCPSRGAYRGIFLQMHIGVLFSLHSGAQFSWTNHIFDDTINAFRSKNY